MVKQVKEIIFFNQFSGIKGLRHFITTRNTLSEPFPRFYSHKGKINESNLKELALKTGINPGSFIFLRQVHSGHISIIKSQSFNIIPDTDGLITDECNKCICIQSADCVPILLYDPEKKVIGAVHAGWRGTIKKISLKAVEKMNKSFGSNPEDILACIGPSISPDVYVVGREVINKANRIFKDTDGILINCENNKAYFNLWESNRKILIDSGLKDSNIEISGLCTYKQNDLFFSARKEGRNTGRLVVGIMLE